MSPDSPTSGRGPPSPIASLAPLLPPPSHPVFAKAKSDMQAMKHLEVVKSVEFVKPSWAKIVRSASKV